MTTILSFLLALSSVLNAQDFIGRWTQDVPASDDASAIYTMAFADDGHVTEEVLVGINVAEGDSSNVSIRLKISCEGSWSLEEGVLSLCYDRKTMKVVILESAGLPKLLLGLVKSKVISKYAQRMKDTIYADVVSLKDGRLVLKFKGSGKTGEFIRTDAE